MMRPNPTESSKKSRLIGPNNEERTSDLDVVYRV
jgi:hypothetical protein